MSTTQWKIITNFKGKSHHIELDVYDKSLEPLSSFFFTASESRYPSIIESALQGVGSGFNGTGITFPNDLDEYDLTQRNPIDIDMVELYDPISDVQIPQTTFLQALLEAAEAILTVRQELGKSSKEWEEQMKKAISDLRARLG